MDHNKVIELIELLPDDVEEKLMDIFGEILMWRRDISDDVPYFFRVLLANIFGKNIVKVLKDAGIDGRHARGMVVEVMRWAFTVSADWIPKWATKPMEA